MKMPAALLAYAAAGAAVAFGAANPAEVVADTEAHTVSFYADAVGHDEGTTVEFLLVGPDSDHDYEALFMTVAPIDEIAKAMERAGIPRGRDFDIEKWRFWPVGERVEIVPSVTNLLRDAESGSAPSVLYSGGLRDLAGFPVAQTNSPGAVLALYNCPQSLFQLNDTLGQSETYGRFKPAKKFEKGERVRFMVRWDGLPTHDSFVLGLKPGRLKESLETLRTKSAANSLDVTCDFSPELTLKAAAEISSALAVLDSPRIKFNGVTDGQYYFRAYLPLEKWRDRKERLAQPPEVHLHGDGTVTVSEIIEDWSDETSLDPKLSVREHAFPDIASAAKCVSPLVGKTYTVLVFAPDDTTLGRLYELRRNVTAEVLNWYVFAENADQNLEVR